MIEKIGSDRKSQVEEKPITVEGKEARSDYTERNRLVLQYLPLVKAIAIRIQPTREC